MIYEPIEVTIIDDKEHVKNAATRIMRKITESKIKFDIESIALLFSFLRQCGVDYEMY